MKGNPKPLTERDLLVMLYNFITSKQIVMGDEDSIRDMVARYKSPPFSMAYPACMRMTLSNTHELNDLLQKTYNLMVSTADTPLSTPVVKVEDDEPTDEP